MFPSIMHAQFLLLHSFSVSKVYHLVSLPKYVRMISKMFYVNVDIESLMNKKFNNHEVLRNFNRFTSSTKRVTTCTVRMVKYEISH